MVIKSGLYRDYTSKIDYFIDKPLDFNDKNIYLIVGNNGVGKTRFVEGVLLDKLRENKQKILYFGQDLENQILTFELISLVKEFIKSLKESGKFFKTILFNDNSHKDINVKFDTANILNPNEEYIQSFILKECHKNSADVIIFDEVDKYFSGNNFEELISNIKCDRTFIISHLITRENKNIVSLASKGSKVNVSIN